LPAASASCQCRASASDRPLLTLVFTLFVFVFPVIFFSSYPTSFSHKSEEFSLLCSTFIFGVTFIRRLRLCKGRSNPYLALTSFGYGAQAIASSSSSQPGAVPFRFQKVSISQSTQPRLTRRLAMVFAAFRSEQMTLWLELT
jgi:hypothetical protein